MSERVHYKREGERLQRKRSRKWTWGKRRKECNTKEIIKGKDEDVVLRRYEGTSMETEGIEEGGGRGRKKWRKKKF